MKLHPLLAITMLAVPSAAWAQGQDSTPAERDIMVIAEMLPGIYDNVEQVYFDQRRKLPQAQRHDRARISITRVAAPAFGERVFFVKESLAPDFDKPTLLRLYAFSVDNAESAVRMRIFDLGDPGTSPYRAADSDPGVLTGLVPANAKSEPECDVLWRREAGHFHATGLPTCRGEAKGSKVRRELDMMLDARSLWIRSRRLADDGQLLGGPVDGVHYKFNRARQFQCHADMPGVGGGRNEPFKRYGPFAVLDQGGEVTFRPDEASAREVTSACAASTGPSTTRQAPSRATCWRCTSAKSSRMARQGHRAIRLPSRPCAARVSTSAGSW
jgi:hypothetical protein